MKSILVISLVVATAAGSSFGGRIFGGDNAAPGQFPFIVVLNNPNQFCDGSIIDKQWIVTAAHCLIGINNTATVLAGTIMEHSGGTSFNIAKTVIHEDYDQVTGKNDIGLIQIDGELEFDDFTQPIEFIDPEVDAVCTVLGWGQEAHEPFPENVQYAQTNIIDLEDCQERSEGHLGDLYLGPEEVCTLAPEGIGACFGDSGGPLVCDGKMAGIISYSVKPCAQGFPDVYTKPIVYADWVRKIIQE